MVKRESLRRGARRSPSPPLALRRAVPLSRVPRERKRPLSRPVLARRRLPEAETGPSPQPGLSTSRASANAWHPRDGAEDSKDAQGPPPPAAARPVGHGEASMAHAQRCDLCAGIVKARPIDTLPLHASRDHDAPPTRSKPLGRKRRSGRDGRRGRAKRHLRGIPRPGGASLRRARGVSGRRPLRVRDAGPAGTGLSGAGRSRRNPLGGAAGRSRVAEPRHGAQGMWPGDAQLFASVVQSALGT